MAWQARDFYRHRDLVTTLVVRELKVRYRRSFLGFIWTMLQPLLMMLIMQLVFSNLFSFELPNYPVYALVGILFWNFFSQTLVASMNSLRSNAMLVQKIAVNRAVFPLATLASGVVNLLLALVPLLLILLLTRHPLSPAILFLPMAILLGASFTLGAALLLSPLAVFFVDIVELVSTILMLVMYLTPIFYPISILPAKVAWIVHFNPLRLLLDLFRNPIYIGQLPSASQFGFALLFAGLSLIVGLEVFRRSSDRIPYYV